MAALGRPVLVFLSSSIAASPKNGRPRAANLRAANLRAANLLLAELLLEELPHVGPTLFVGRLVVLQTR